MLAEQIPIILVAHKSPGVPAENEAREGYQVSGQFVYEEGSTIFVGDTKFPISLASGDTYLHLLNNVNNQSQIRGFVTRICHRDETLGSWDVPNNLNQQFGSVHKARWVKLANPPASTFGREILEEAIEVCPDIRTPNFKGKGIDIVGIVFPEESEYLKSALNWAFVVRRQRPKGKKGCSAQFAPALVRSDRLDRTNLSARTPRLRGLESKSVVLVGAGALGSHIAWQLVRAGVKSITLIDHDIVQAGNISRWVVGFPWIGHPKVKVLAQYFRESYPHVECKPLRMYVGVDQQLNVDDIKYDAHDFFVNDILSGADLLIDATAESNVSMYLSDVCHQNGINYMWATGTQGAWGGIVGRIIPGVTEGEWRDFAYKSDAGEIPLPAAEDGSDVQPVGCFHPTFTGTGIDLDHISLMAARLAISTLSVNDQQGYPSFDWDIAVLNLWDEKSGKPISPSWETIVLSKYVKNEDA